MGIRKFLLVLITVLCCQFLTAQEGKLSWYYPKLGEAEPRSGKKGLYTLNMHGAQGCVSGDCKSGNGEYLTAFPPYDSTLEFMAIDPAIRLTLYKGKFSNNGKDFEGTVYSRKVYYDLGYKKDEPRLTPKERYDLREESFWKPFEIATGSMQHDAFYFKWNGWMQPFQDEATIEPGQPKLVRMHTKNNLTHTKIQYMPGGAYSEVEGLVLPSGDMIGGRLRFSDSTIYEGFLHNGSRFGPGRYTTNDGKVEEGIWMRDSLAIVIPVSLPKELFEPVDETVPTIGKFSFGGFAWPVFKDAGNGWIYSFYQNDIYIGKRDGDKLNGPGFYFTKSATPNHEQNKAWHTFRTGLFKDGKLEVGMRARDVVDIIANHAASSTSVKYKRNYTTVVTGEFKDDLLKPSCGKLVRYDAKGNAVSMVEGSFVPGSFNAELADGWSYVNDWQGKREAENLHYMYNNQDYLKMDGSPNYVTWFTRGLKESATANWCFPSMQVQATPIIPLMKHRHDSVAALAAKKEADILANKEAFRKRELACQAEASKYNYPVGDLYQVGEGVHPTRILITGYYSCYTKSFPVLTQNWFQSTKNTGYLRTASTNMSVEKLKLAKKIHSGAAACQVCEGRGTMPATVYSDVGGSSGYTAVGGGWAVKNPETYWKSEVMLACKACAGIGFVRR